MIHQSDVTTCSLTPSLIANAPLRVAVSQAATATHTTLVNTLPLFCSSTLCPLFVNDHGKAHLIYQDQWHMNIVYSGFIANALAPLLQGAGIAQ
jgi:hypothetical protein